LSAEGKKVMATVDNGRTDAQIADSAWLSMGEVMCVHGYR
jgi:hypothetical protein